MNRLLPSMVLCASVCCHAPALAYVLGSDVVWGSSDYTSKWGSPVLGTGATVTWSSVPGGRRLQGRFQWGRLQHDGAVGFHAGRFRVANSGRA